MGFITISFIENVKKKAIRLVIIGEFSVINVQSTIYINPG